MGSLKHVSLTICHNCSLLHTNWRFSYTVHYHIQNFSLTFLGVTDQFMRWLMHPHASESGSYTKASIFSGFTVGVLLLSHTYLHGKNNSPQSAFYIDWTKTRLYGWAVDCYSFGPVQLTCAHSEVVSSPNFLPLQKIRCKSCLHEL